MVQRSLLAVLTLLVAAPVAAQDTIWTSTRPDGHAPLGIHGARTLPVEEFEVTYRFSKMDDKGIWFDNDSLPLFTTLDFYQVAPLTQNNLSHEIEVAYGLTEELTLMGSLRYVQLERRQQTDDDLLYITEADDLGDLEVHGIYDIFRSGPYMATAKMGVLIPIGASDPQVVTPFSGAGGEPLSYDMRPGAGVFAAMPGLTAQVQNEAGTVGAQLQGQLHFGENDSGFTPGDRFEGTFWAAYRINDAFSVSARLDYQSWTRVEGFDPRLDPFRDPSHDGFFAEGSRTSIPIGINFVMPESSPVAGYRLAVEYIYPIDQEFEGPQLGFSRGLIVGVQTMLP